MSETVVQKLEKAEASVKEKDADIIAKVADLKVATELAEATKVKVDAFDVQIKALDAEIVTLKEDVATKEASIVELNKKITLNPVVDQPDGTAAVEDGATDTVVVDHLKAYKEIANKREAAVYFKEHEKEITEACK